MEQELYIIKRVPWSYDGLNEYLDEQGTFTRDLKSIKVFNSISDAYESKYELQSNDFYRENIYQIITM